MQKFNISNYNFIDFGCSKGNSIKEAIKFYGGDKGLGIDIDPNKVKETNEEGFDAIVQDATTFSEYHPKSVEFVTMIHFLEHLPGASLAKKCIASAVELSTDFVYIRQPFFDSDSYLFENDLKFYWSDWSGHTNQMTSLQFHNIVNPMKTLGDINSFKIYGLRKVGSSRDTTIHSLNSPVDQHHFNPDIHPEKNIITFEQKVFKEILVVITLNPELNSDYLLANYKDQYTLLYDSGR